MACEPFFERSFREADVVSVVRCAAIFNVYSRHVNNPARQAVYGERAYVGLPAVAEFPLCALRCMEPPAAEPCCFLMMLARLLMQQ